MSPTDNTSGQGDNAVVPAEIDRWNWGAFLLNWIWGIGNNTLIALLMFVPLVNFVMLFMLGFKGSDWAWRNKRWDSIEQFRRVQRSWARWGVVVWVGWLAFMLGLFFLITSIFQNSEPYQLALARLEASEQAQRMIGRPMSTGMPSGSIRTSGPDGSASLSFSVEGPNGEGTVYLRAQQELGQWTFTHFVLEQQGTRVDLAP